MGLDEAIDITAEQRKTLLELLERYLPNTAAWVYGSRAKRTSRPQSDLDLVVFATPEQNGQVGELREAFEESNLPFRVDLFVWDTVPGEFRKHIKRDHVALAVKGNRVVEVGWRETALGHVVEFLSGGTPSKAQTAYWNGSVPWVSAKDMKRFRLRDTEDHVTAEGVANGTNLVPAGTVLLLVRGMTLLNDLPVCTTEQPMTFNQDVKALRPIPGLDPDFLPYLVLGNKRRLLNLVDLAGHGTGRLNSEELKALDVQLPPLLEQRAIAHILGTLDDKIELSRRMNETLEAMARALFKSWFVDFDPVRAKMEGRNTGLPQEIAGLFPDRLVESELGLIPEGWKVESLEVIAQLEKATVKPEDHATEEFEHFSLPAYDSGQIPALDLGSTIKSNKTFVPPQAVLLSKLNPEIQRVWLPTSASSCRQISSTEFLVFTAKPPIGRVGLYSLFNTQSFRDLLKGMVTGTSKSHQRVAPKSLATQAMIVPADRVANKFEALAWPVLERTLCNKSENHTLAALRDTLLPKLISGKMRVDTERIVEIA